MGTQDLFALERDNGKVVAVHIISRNRICESGSYTATISYEAFKSREIKRAFPEGYVNLGTRKSIHWFSMYVKEHFDDDQEITQSICKKLTGKKLIQPWHNKPEIYHNSIWDFYKYIGYDYKRKRYMEK